MQTAWLMIRGYRLVSSFGSYTQGQVERSLTAMVSRTGWETGQVLAALVAGGKEKVGPLETAVSPLKRLAMK